jgi:hypothetical protein
VEVARQQVANGAQIIDVNMDEAMLDSKAAMVRFLNLIASEPDIARVPVMIDSSKWEVIEAGLKCVQGKAVVNSISMKEGEAEFVRQAKLVRRYGAAAIVMGFRREGPGRHVRAQGRDRAARRTTSSRSKSDFPAEDIIFDPNIFAIATGIEEHNNYAVDFHQRDALDPPAPAARQVSGGVSNVSFSFRGNEPVREAIHTVFLYHAIRAGHDDGHRQRRPARRLRRDSARAPRARRGCRAQPAARSTGAAGRAGRIVQVAGQAGAPKTCRGATRRSSRACRTRWCAASRRTSSRTPRKRGSSTRGRFR